MCENCGCSSFYIDDANEIDGEVKKIHQHSHAEGEEHDHSHDQSSTIYLGTDILSKNKLLAERNRGFFEAKKIHAFNFVSSPGSGKTTLLEKLIRLLKSSKKIYVIEGDQQTSVDAKRIEAAGARAIQINTGSGCHLDAHMIHHAVEELNPEDGSILFIENVGNLVCPALFDLGEHMRIIISSTPEGEDKPLKYPAIFESSDFCLLNKIDLMPHLDFNMNLFETNLRKVKSTLKMLPVSAKTGEGLEELIKIIRQ